MAGNEPVRAVAADADWFGRLTGLMAPDGVLVMNFATTEELSRSAWYASAGTRRSFKVGFRLSTGQNENAVGAFLRRSGDSRQLRLALSGMPGLDPARKTTRLRYRIQRLHKQ